MCMPTSGAPLIVTVAPNGAYKTHADHPAVPLTPESLATTAKSCLDAGAAMIHLHVRHADGRHSLDRQDYLAATQQVRRAVGAELVIQITTEAAQVYGPHEQMAAVRAVRPEAVSVGLRELMVEGVTEAELAAFFAWLASENIMTQVILYDVADVQRWTSLRSRGVIGEGAWFLLFVLGRYSAGQVSAPRDLLPFLAADDGVYPWSMCAFGKQEHACAIAAAALGGHARVGFENNLYLRDGTLAADNAALVRQVAEGARALGRPLAVAEDIRRRFGKRI
jgi:3-keto-5-aminohexanoate cleavage enzyme